MRALVIVWLLGGVAAAQSTDDEAAKRHYLAGQAYFSRARYDDALREFQESYRLSHREAISYNLGLCEEKLDRVDDAIASLERYLAAEPDSPRKESVNELLEGLRARQREKARAAPPAPPAEAAPTATPAPAAPPAETAPPPAPPAPVLVETAPPSRHRLRPAAIAVAGLTLASVLAAAGAYGVAASQYDQLHDVTCVARPCVPGDWSGAQSAATAGYALFGVAGAAAAADVVLWILQVRY
jgi:tetratricopeptide (TPR) repeat protein